MFLPFFRVLHFIPTFVALLSTQWSLFSFLRFIYLFCYLVVMGFFFLPPISLILVRVSSHLGLMSSWCFFFRVGEMAGYTHVRDIKREYMNILPNIYPCVC